MSQLSLYALELEVLVARAARRGWLDIEELLETYARLQPTGHPELANVRKVDVVAAANALASLPIELMESEKVLVVPRLDAFPHEPVRAAAGMRGGLLSDGTLLLEAQLGVVSLVDLAATLCALQHEVYKALALLPSELLEDAAESPDVLDEYLADDDALMDELEAEPETHAAPEADAPAQPEPDVPAQADSEPEPETPATGDDFRSDDDDGDDDDASEEVDEAALSHLAFAWGTDPDTLWRGNVASEGTLLHLLLGHAQLPRIEVHADLEPGAIAGRKQATAQRMLSTLAEMGLLSRPVHLWIGSGVLTECLSPYARDMRPLLHRWVAHAPEALGEDLAGIEGPLREDAMYAAAHDFVRCDSRLVDEREAADRTAGVMRFCIDDVAFECIDLSRIDLDVCDARLAQWGVETPAPVILRLPADLGDPEANLLRALLEALGPVVASATVLLQGTVLTGAPGTVLLPHLLLRWAGEQKISLPVASSFDADDFHGYTDSAVQHGAVLSVPSASLVSARRIAELQQQLNIAAIEVGGAGALGALNDALWCGTLSTDAKISWVLVSTQQTSTGRPSVASLAGMSAVAIAKLREVVAPVPPQPEPVVTQEPTQPRRAAPSRRAIRIKA